MTGVQTCALPISLQLHATQYDCLNLLVLPRLQELGVKIVKMEELTTEQKAAADQYFEAEISPVLTPLAFDPAHPFPFLSNRSLYLTVRTRESGINEANLPGIGFVEIPPVVPRLIPIKSNKAGELSFVLLEDLIAHHLHSLFFGFEVEASFTMRVIRNLDYNLLENKVVDLLKSIQKEVANRDHQEVVRLEVDRELPPAVLALLKERLSLTDDDIYLLPNPLFIPALMPLYAALTGEELHDAPFNPRLPPALATTEDMFSVIAKKDLMVHHPYESFYAVTEFLHLAAHDPNVLAIKQTLYRTAGDSPIIEALIADRKSVV